MTHRPITVRPTQTADIPALTGMLNAIIEIGGTTAYEEARTHAQMHASLLDDAKLVCCHTALDPASSEPAGYQTLRRHPELPADAADIATFARPEPKLRGAGTALFDKTLAVARGAGLVWINATIRADNTGGLAFYTKMGFVDYAVAHGVPLNDGTPVDRISKRFLIS